MRAQTTSSRAVPATACGAALVSSAGLYFVNPNKHTLLICPLHATTGLWCPFCGATRATYALMHGDFMTAVHDNLMYILALPLLLILGLRWLVLGGRTPMPNIVGRRPQLGRWLLMGFIVATLVFTTIRNLPLGSWFAPST